MAKAVDAIARIVNKTHSKGKVKKAPVGFGQNGFKAALPNAANCVERIFRGGFRTSESTGCRAEYQQDGRKQAHEQRFCVFVS